MKILDTALSLTVADPAASSAFLARHFGFREVLAFDGGAALAHPDAGVTVFFLRVGLESIIPSKRETLAQGVILALTVEDIAAEEARLRQAGVGPSTPLQEEDYGERHFQVTDPNGVTIQLVQWVGERPY